MKLNRSNKFPGKCCICAVPVPAQAGFLVGAQDSLDEAHRTGRRKWLTLCRSTVCVDVFGGRWTVEDATRRELSEDGTIVMPYDDTALPLLQSIAKATREGTQWRWTATKNPGDRQRVLEVAQRLQLRIHPSWHEVEHGDETKALLAKARTNGAFDHQIEGIEWLATRPRGVDLSVRGCVLGDDPGLGKQHPVDTKILTPSGWCPIGALRVGDLVIGSTGAPVRVTGVFPQGVKPSYRVHMSDYSSVEAGPEHLWSVTYMCGGKRRRTITLTTDQLRMRPKITGARHCAKLDLAKTRLYLPIMQGPAQFAPVNLPIPPYTLGALIANGGLTSANVLTTGAADWADVSSRIQAEGMCIGTVQRPTPTVTRATIRGLNPRLRQLGLKVLSRDKYIPDVYQRGSVEERIALLHGLMDGDGSCSATQNRLTYHTTSPRLASGVVELVEGLGGIASVATHERDGSTDYAVRVRVPPSIPPFSLHRKLQRYQPKKQAHPVRRIERVEYVRDVESVCIAVDAEDQLYATEHAILTHNTTQVLHSVPPGYALVVICPANAKPTWLREPGKWLPDRFPSVHVCEGNESFRWPTHPGEIVVANYDITPFTKPQIVKERDRLLGQRHGVQPDPQGKTKAARLGRVGLLQDLDRVVGGWRRVVTDETERGKRLRLFREIALLAGWLELSRKLHRNRRALMRNVKRKAVGKPNLPIVLVLDECHVVSNVKARRTQNAERLSAFADLVIGLTGTPVEHDPLKLYGMLKVCRCRVWDWAGFLDAFNGFRGEHGGTDFMRETPVEGSTARGAVVVKPGTADRLRAVILRRTKDEVTDLPPKVFEELIVPVERKLLEQLDEITQECIAEIMKGRVPKFPKMATVRKALEISRIPAALVRIQSFEAQGTPLVVFADHRALIEQLRGRAGWGVVMGGTSTDERDRIFEGFQRGDLIGVAGTIKAMNVSATLTRASHELFVGQSLARTQNKQAQNRCHRIGQTGTVNITIMMSDHPFDQHVADLLAAKDTFVERVLDERMEYTPGGGLVAETREAWLSRLPEHAQARYAREAEVQLNRLDAMKRIAKAP